MYTVSLSCIIFVLVLGASAAVTQQQSDNNDVTTLNYALTLEHLEATFYNTYQAMFDSAAFVAAGFTAQDYSYFTMIQGHENNHVTFLTNTIQSLGGTPVAACTYDFGVSTVLEYVATARILESTGVMAYDGALKTLNNRELQQGAASIATVEARHAEYLNELNGMVPFPAAFDVPKTPAQIAHKIAGLFVSCPQKLKLPTVDQIALSMANLTFPNGTTVTHPSQSIVTANDLKTLNYALVLEHLESAFYDHFYNTFSRQQVIAAGYSNVTYNYLGLIRMHEMVHVQALTTVISSVGGSPYPECTYDFSSITTVAQYIASAQTFENVGVSAYDGAANTITNKAFLQTAATIATIEARHAGYLNSLNGESPFPAAFDETRTPSEVAAIVQAYQTCSFTIYLPEVLQIKSIASKPSKSGSGSGSGSGKTGEDNKTGETGKTGKTGDDNKSGPDNKTGKTGKTGKDGKTGDSNKTGEDNSKP